MDLYSFTKIIHLLAVFSWMAALFYLPRLFVYHSANKDKEQFVSIVITQERRLYFAIAIPAMVLALLSGIGLIVLDTSVFKGGWLHMKLFFVILLVIYHHICGYYVKKFSKGVEVTKSAKYFRIFNEVPTILLIGIIIPVVLRF